jgi:hypothetical protein
MVFFGNWDFWVVRGKRVRRTKENAVLGGLEHTEVVVAVATGNNFEVKLLQILYGLSLVVGDPKAVIGDGSVFIDFEFMAKKRGISKLFHERVCKFTKSVRENDKLVGRAKFV